MVSLVPKSIMLATAGGIGLFLAFIGLQNSEGIGLVSYNSATLVTLGEHTHARVPAQRMRCVTRLLAAAWRTAACRTFIRVCLLLFTVLLRVPGTDMQTPCINILFDNRLL
eukprot:GHRQ01034355.1.p1 GENE.GHRQ01034355.1~~GHRQ01034355.1.p1  ORF type:complete len:111 (+),score=14.68 GHRQ01034355.1:321-653(+)